MGQIQHVSVSKWTSYFLFVECIYIYAVIPCPNLPPLPNGMIIYSVGGSTDNRLVGSTATHSCDSGYRLVGVSVRTCGSESTWSGSAPACQRKWNGLCTIYLLNVVLTIYRYLF